MPRPCTLWRTVGIVLFAALAACAEPLAAAAIFGPEDFAAAGKPRDVVRFFSNSLDAPTYTLFASNGFGSRRALGAGVWLNGVQVLTAADLNFGSAALERTVTLLPTNELRVRLPGSGEGSLGLRISAVLGSEGGTVSTAGGARLTLPPGAAGGEIEIGLEDRSLAQLPLSPPPGFTFLGAVALDLGGVTLAAEADLALPMPTSVPGPVLVARVVDLGDLHRLRVVDTASPTADGYLETASPPFPGVLASGEYVFLTLPPDLGVAGAHVRTAQGEPVAGASVGLVLASPGSAAPAAIDRSLASLGAFVAETDATGFAALPGALAHSDWTIVAVQSRPPGPPLAGATLFSVGDILANGLLGNWLQEVVLEEHDLGAIPSYPSPCPCTVLTPQPAQIPDPGGIFLPGSARGLTVLCGTSDVTRSTDLSASSVALALLATGASVVLTSYQSGDPSVASVGPQGSAGEEVAAHRRGQTSIAIETLLQSLVRLDERFLVQTCPAPGAVQPVRVDCPTGQLWDPALEVCRPARLSAVRIGSEAADGIVTSAPDPRIDCGSRCQADADLESTLTLNAGVVPDSDAMFMEWGGDCAPCGSSPTCPLQVLGDSLCTARFECPYTAPNVAILQASRALGGASLPIPRCGRTIRVTVTVPNNMISGHGTTGNCGNGDVRVSVRVCPPNAGCSGFDVPAGQGQGLDICHDFDETLGPFDIPNPRKAGTGLSFVAITEKTATARIETRP